MRTPSTVMLALSLVLASAACRPPTEKTAEAEPPTAQASGSTAPPAAAGQAPAGLTADAIRTYADIVHASYAAGLNGAKTLSTAIDTLLAEPSDANLAAARKAWTDGNVLYSRTEVFRFYDGPIDAPETGPEGRINSWPLDEAYLDYVDGQPEAGLVNAVTEHPELTPELLIRLNAEGGEAKISTGWHAIEFLLWGQDLSAYGPGNRPVADYIVGQGVGAERRRQLLKLLATQLETDLAGLAAAWDPATAGNYRADFLNLPAPEALGKVLKGMGSLSGAELMGERMTVPFSTQDQEEEVNCFSDTTIASFLGDQDGIRTVWRGSHDASDPAIDGPGIDALLRAIGQEALATELDAAIDAAGEAIEGIPAPFDQAILGVPGSRGPLAIEGALAALEKQTELLGKAAVALGVQVQGAE